MPRAYTEYVLNIFTFVHWFAVEATWWFLLIKLRYICHVSNSVVSTLSQVVICVSGSYPQMIEHSLSWALPASRLWPSWQ